jgi:hypothetical protein
MNHFAVHRRAEYAGESVIALKCSLHAEFLQTHYGGILEVKGGGTRFDHAAHQL